MTNKDPAGRKSSDVLEAIFDKVEDKPQPPMLGPSIYRRRALEQLDVATEVDNQLPLISRRTWLLLVGVMLVAAAFLVWAALTPSITSVSAPGRVLQSPGLYDVVSPVDGILLTEEAAAGGAVTEGQAIATVQQQDGTQTQVTALGGGTVWQVIATPGDAVSLGTTIVTLIPANSAGSMLLAVAENDARAVQPGMQVSTPFSAAGKVESVGAPLPGSDVGPRLGLALDAQTNYSIVTVDLGAQATPAASGQGVIVVSNESVLSKVLAR